MPGPMVHLIVQQRLERALRKLAAEYPGVYPDALTYADVLKGDRCSPYTAFGSIGPDYLFFSLAEYGTPLDDLLNLVFGVYDAFEPLVDFYEDNIEPVIDQIEDAVVAVDEALFQGLFGNIKAAADAANLAALTAAAAVVTQQVDLFYLFYPKIQQGAPESEWYWFDFLHYRRTGQFATRMWQLAGTDPDLQRYVLGYVSHIGVDVVGHPFVNLITGGPYRTHWHRHKLVENWIDAYARKRYPDRPRTRNCLQLDNEDDYVGDAVSGSYYYRLVEFEHGRLPDKLTAMISKAMHDVYPASIEHPGHLSANDIDSTYRLWLKWFERTTTVGAGGKPTPPPPPGAGAAALVASFVGGFPPSPTASAPSWPPNPGFGGFFASMSAFLQWLADIVSYTIDWIIANAAAIMALPVTEALSFLNWLVYQIHKGIWELYDNLRFMLVLGAYLFPEPRDLTKMPWGLCLLNSNFAHWSGGPFPTFFDYPLTEEAHALTGTTEHHLVYPSTVMEAPHAEPAPQPFRGQFPEIFIDQALGPYNADIEKLYDCVGPYGSTTDKTHYVDSQTWQGGQFGNALRFSARLIASRIGDVPNFNLDGDRGYGWKTWRANEPALIQTSNPLDVHYVDP
ncbi:MAG: hypothetical protein M3217_01760 [Actinomycetota bacterium]|nr:hypothetical protein [Actinomycetota bacterium]